MKTFFASVFFVALAVIAGSQTAAFASQPESIDAERAKLSAERSRLDAVFSVEGASCYEKFFVNHCLGDVNKRRREALAELRRQEVSLNDEERRTRGAEHIRKAEEKASLEKQQEAADRRAKALEDHRSRLETGQEKGDQRAATQSREKARSAANADRLKANQEKSDARSAKQEASAEAVKKFNARQSQARERRAQRDADQFKRVKPPAKSLPLPE